MKNVIDIIKEEIQGFNNDNLNIINIDRSTTTKKSGEFYRAFFNDALNFKTYWLWYTLMENNLIFGSARIRENDPDNPEEIFYEKSVNENELPQWFVNEVKELILRYRVSGNFPVKRGVNEEIQGFNDNTEDFNDNIAQRVADNLQKEPRPGIKNYILANVDMKLAEMAFKNGMADYYIAPEDKGLYNRREKVTELVKKGELKYAPIVYIGMGKNGKPYLSFTDGRHRFAVLRDMGVKSINLAVSPESRKLILLLQKGNLNEEIQGFNEQNINKKLYYHGRKMGGRPYSGTYIFITDNLGYASGYSDGKTLYTYTIPFSTDKIFSIKNVNHRLLLAKYVDQESILHMRADSGEGNELDWAALTYMNSDEFDMPEDILQHLGFYGIYLKERTGIESIYIFNESKLKFEGEIDITTPDMIKQIGNFYADFTKDKNFLETVIKEEISKQNKTVFSEVPDELFNKLKLRKYSDEANRMHMKIFRAKDGREFLLKKIINQDIFYAYNIKTFKLPAAVAVFDVHGDYFTGYEHSESIKVEPEYRRMGLATALTDFAENIYDKPYKPSNLLSGEMQGFVKNRFGQ